MCDSRVREGLYEQHERNREQCIEAVTCWVK